MSDMIGHNGAPADPIDPLQDFFADLAHQAQIYYECHEGEGAIDSQDQANRLKRQVRGLTDKQREALLIRLVNIHNQERLAMKRYNQERNE